MAVAVAAVVAAAAAEMHVVDDEVLGVVKDYLRESWVFVSVDDVGDESLKMVAEVEMKAGVVAVDVLVLLARGCALMSINPVACGYQLTFRILHSGWPGGAVVDQVNTQGHRCRSGVECMLHHE